MIVVSGVHFCGALFSSLVILNNPFLVHCNSDSYSHGIAPYNKHAASENRIDYEIDPPKPGWVDPFDMLGGKVPIDSLFVQGDVDNHMLKNRIAHCETYLRRFVNMFIHAIERKEPSALIDSTTLVQLEFIVSSNDLKDLKDFGQRENGNGNNEYVTIILEKIFSQRLDYHSQQHFTFNRGLNWLKNGFLKLISSPEWTVVTSVSLMLFVTLWFVYKTHSYRLAMFTLLLTIFFAGFGFTWMRMYEEEEIRKYVDHVTNNGVPYHCTGQPLAWYEHMFYRMFGDDCFKFYKTRDVRPIVKISPTDVLAETFSSMIVNPASKIGQAYGNFIRSVNQFTPWYLAPLTVPLSFIIPLLFVILVLALLFNYQMSISWFGFHMKPSWYHSAAAVQHSHDSRYIEDLSQKKNESIQRNSSLQSVVSDTSAPLFLMNWKGLKKLILNVDEDKSDDNTKNQDEIQNSDKEDGGSADEMKDLEELLTTVQKRKGLENRKRKSKTIFTAAEGSSSSSGKTEADEQLSLLASGDQMNKTDAVLNKDIKDKTV